MQPPSASVAPSEQVGTWNRLWSRGQQGKPEMNGAGDVSPSASPQSSRRTGQTRAGATGVNLLPEIPLQGSTRKLTPREQRDCEVIGMYKYSV